MFENTGLKSNRPPLLSLASAPDELSELGISLISLSFSFFSYKKGIITEPSELEVIITVQSRDVQRIEGDQKHRQEPRAVLPCAGSHHPGCLFPAWLSTVRWLTPLSRPSESTFRLFLDPVVVTHQDFFLRKREEVEGRCEKLR